MGAPGAGARPWGAGARPPHVPGGGSSSGEVRGPREDAPTPAAPQPGAAELRGASRQQRLQQMAATGPPVPRPRHQAAGMAAWDGERGGQAGGAPAGYGAVGRSSIPHPGLGSTGEDGNKVMFHLPCAGGTPHPPPGMAQRVSQGLLSISQVPSQSQQQDKPSASPGDTWGRIWGTGASQSASAPLGMGGGSWLFIIIKKYNNKSDNNSSFLNKRAF